MFVFPEYLGQLKMQGIFFKDIYMVPTIKLRARYMFSVS